MSKNKGSKFEKVLNHIFAMPGPNAEFNYYYINNSDFKIDSNILGIHRINTEIRYLEKSSLSNNLDLLENNAKKIYLNECIYQTYFQTEREAHKIDGATVYYEYSSGLNICLYQATVGIDTKNELTILETLVEILKKTPIDKIFSSNSQDRIRYHYYFVLPNNSESNPKERYSKFERIIQNFVKGIASLGPDMIKYCFDTIGIILVNYDENRKKFDVKVVIQEILRNIDNEDDFMDFLENNKPTETVNWLNDAPFKKFIKNYCFSCKNWVNFDENKCLNCDAEPSS